LSFWRHFPEAPPAPIGADPRLYRRLQRALAARRSAIAWAALGVALALPVVFFARELGSKDVSAAGNVVLAGVEVGCLVAAAWLIAWRPIRLQREEHAARLAVQAAEAQAREW